MSKRVLLTGTNGQSGSYMAELLLEKGYEVYGLVRRQSNEKFDNIKHILDKITLIHGDITDSSSLLRALEISEPEECYNFSAQSHVQVSWEQPILTAEIDAIGPLKLLEAIRKYNPKIKIIQASSSEMFGNTMDMPQQEFSHFNPTSPYACFIKNTKIICKIKNKRYGQCVDILGQKSIEKIKIGDEVLSYDEKSGRKIMDVVTKIMDRDTKEIYKIYLSNNNEITCTSEHPFYVVGKGWVATNNLNIGDKLIQYKYAGLNFRLFNLRRKDKTVEEIFGIDTAQRIREKNSLFAKKQGAFRKNKKFEEIFGIEKSKKMKEKIRLAFKNNQHPLKGKTHVQYFGIEKALTIKEKRANSKKLQWQDKTFLEHIEKGKKIGRVKNSIASKKAWSNPNSKLNSKENIDRLIELLKNGREKQQKNRSLWKEKIRCAVKLLWLNPEYVKQQIQSRRKCPNGEEKIIISILDKIVPNEFKYNGGLELGVMIGGKVPDFVDVNSKKKIIEYFGEYWHNKEYKMTEEETIKHYKKYGFDCMIIWGKELKNQNAIAHRIENFTYNPNTEIVKIIKIEKFDKSCKVYNIETKKYHNYFANGILVHNCSKVFAYNIIRTYRFSYNMFAANAISFNHESLRRGQEFVTRKISMGVARIKLGLANKISLGNLSAQRDWSHAKDIVKGMYLIMQHKEPDDFVLCSGETHSIREFLTEAFKCIDIEDWTPYVEINQKFMRPAEVNLLQGDYTKAKTVLNWQPTISFKELVKEMVENDIKLLKSP